MQSQCDYGAKAVRLQHNHSAFTMRRQCFYNRLTKDILSHLKIGVQKTGPTAFTCGETRFLFFGRFIFI